MSPLQAPRSASALLATSLVGSSSATVVLALSAPAQATRRLEATSAARAGRDERAEREAKAERSTKGLRCMTEFLSKGGAHAASSSLSYGVAFVSIDPTWRDRRHRKSGVAWIPSSQRPRS